MKGDLFKERFKEDLLDEKLFLGEITYELKLTRIKEALRYLKEEEGFERLTDLTGVDYFKPIARVKLVYLLTHPDTFERVRVTAYVKREESADSITDLWAGADWYERELWDMFGVHFKAHPDLKRILMPDDWVGHPMRKDYPLTEEPVQFINGPKPKIPSEIIPHVDA